MDIMCTGHREISFPQEVYQVVRDFYWQYDYKFGVAGGAEGADTIFAEATRDAGHRPHNAKLTFEIAEEIRSKYVPRIYSQSKLAKEYNISQTVVGDIINYRTWKELKTNE